MVENLGKVKGLFNDWWSVAERVKNMVDEGDDYLYVDEED